MKKAKDLLFNYGVLTMSYGLGRMIPILYDAKVQTYDKNGDKIQVPILLTTKVAIASMSTISSIYLWPLYLYNDISKLEIYSRGYNPEHYDYKQPKYVIDYLFN
jgi:hypothetical protein